MIKVLIEMVLEIVFKKMDDGEFLEVGIDDVEVIDILLVKMGVKVFVDGIVLSGSVYINEVSIIGEVVFVKKVVDFKVFVGMILDNGIIEIIV